VLKERTLPAGFIAPYLPTRAPEPPSGPLWLHEIKHDGFPGNRPQGWLQSAAL